MRALQNDTGEDDDRLVACRVIGRETGTQPVALPD